MSVRLSSGSSVAGLRASRALGLTGAVTALLGMQLAQAPIATAAELTVTATIQTPTNSTPIGVAVSPDGSTVYVIERTQSVLAVISAADNSVTATIPIGNNFGAPASPTGVAVSPDGSTVYVTNNSANSVSAINATTHAVTTIADPSFNYPEAVAVSPDGSTVYVTNKSANSVSAINATTHAVTSITDPSFNNPGGLAVSPDGSTVYVFNSGGNSVSAINTATHAVTPITDPSFNYPEGVAVSPDGSTVYVTNTLGNSVSEINTATHAVTSITDPSFNHPTGVATSPDGSTVYVTNYLANSVSAISTATGSVSGTVAVGKDPNAVAVSPEGSTVYVTNNVGDSVSVITSTPAPVLNGKFKVTEVKKSATGFERYTPTKPPTAGPYVFSDGMCDAKGGCTARLAYPEDTNTDYFYRLSRTTGDYTGHLTGTTATALRCGPGPNHRQTVASNVTISIAGHAADGTVNKIGGTLHIVFKPNGTNSKCPAGAVTYNLTGHKLS